MGEDMALNVQVLGMPYVLSLEGIVVDEVHDTPSRILAGREINATELSLFAVGRVRLWGCG